MLPLPQRRHQRSHQRSFLGRWPCHRRRANGLQGLQRRAAGRAHFEVVLSSCRLATRAAVVDGTMGTADVA